MTKIKLRLNKHFGWEFFARSAYGMDILAIYDFTGKISLNGSHSKIIEDAVNELEEGDCFIDIGANAGIFSLIASKRVGSQGQVVSFEPNPEVFRILQINLIHNKSYNVLPFCAGVGSEDANLSFVFAPHHNGLGHLKLEQNYKWEREQQKETRVLVMGKNSLHFLKTISKNKKKTIIKIDTEGAEYLVLQGIAEYLKDIKPYKVIVEISSDHLTRFGHSAEQIYKKMQELDLKPTVKESAPNHENDHYDEVFIKT